MTLSSLQGESQVNVFHPLVEIGLLPFYKHGFFKLHLVLSGCRVQDLEAIRCAGCSTKFKDLKQKSSPVFHGANFSPEEHKTKHKVPSHSSSDSDEQDEVPKQEDVYRWPHLRGFVYLTELNSRLSGSDVPEALQRKEVIPAAGGGPYASKVEFG